MALSPAWIVRVQVPVGARSWRRPLAELRAVLAAIHRHPRAGALGAYARVEHLALGLERFVVPATSVTVRVPIVTVVTYLCDATRADAEAIARAVAAVHPWEHPVVECDGPEGPFVWMPDA
jgi:hypothetical protein